MLKTLIAPALTFLLCFTALKATACSMCKITSHGKTVVGNNEDTWHTDSNIWFERGGPGKFGAVYMGRDNGVPQGGMNEAGLAFDGLTVYPRTLYPLPGKKTISSPTEFLKSIMQHCTTVHEVKDFVTQYDRSQFNYGMYLFVDKTGDYLVVEVDTVILGNDPTYILVNFCPSQTRPEDVKHGRYIQATSFVREHLPEASVSYCTRLMDRMHVCRSKIGDGTTYTNVYDLSEGLITLYFYHDFSRKVVFRLKDELVKPDRSMKIASLFPINKEYLALKSYLTPFNTPPIQVIMAAGHLFFMIAALFYIFLFIRNRLKPALSRPLGGYVYLALAFTNSVLAYLIRLLLEEMPIFYFDFPYNFEQQHWLVNSMNYVPPALLIAFAPLVYFTVRMVKAAKPNKFIIAVLFLNLILYLTFLAGSGYWGLLGII